MSLSFSSVKATLSDDQQLTLPPMLPVRQRFPDNTIPDIDTAVSDEITCLDGLDLKGKTVAVTAGSRGIKSIVDEIGKDFSGGGLDTNVTGRSAWGLPGFTAPPIQRIIVRGLSKATRGNAIGIGLADFTTRSCAEKINLAITYTNAITAHSLLSPKIPVITENDLDALSAALRTLRGGIPEAPKIVRIVNTKDLEFIWMSETYSEVFRQYPDIEVMGPPQSLEFNTDGSLIT